MVKVIVLSEKGADATLWLNENLPDIFWAYDYYGKPGTWYYQLGYFHVQFPRHLLDQAIFFNLRFG